MKINANAVFMRVSRGLSLASFLVGVLTVTPGFAQEVRLYTNADLKRLASDDAAKGGTAVRNSDLKAPLETQGKGLSGATLDKAEWDALVVSLDREREYHAKTRESELKYQQEYLEQRDLEKALDYYHYARLDRYQSYPYYYTYYGCPYYPSYGSVGLDRFERFSIPSNPYVSLSQRGIHSAVDLYRESVRDSVIRRSNMP